METLHTPYRNIPGFPSHPQLVVAESTRLGGVSTPPHASLNLGLATPDDPAAVAENRRIFLAALGLVPEQLATAHQIHGLEILHVEAPGRYSGYDALITQTPGIILGVSTADCAPVLIVDYAHQAVAAIHAGWKGTRGQLPRLALAAMTAQFGTAPADCWAYVGTCISASAFEVDADVADFFDHSLKHWDDARGKFLVDLKKANQQTLVQAGVPSGQITQSPYCTVAHNQWFFSHRREKGQTGRLLNVVGFRR